MSDVVVTVPKAIWSYWLAEGDLAFGGVRPAPWEGGAEYGFNLGGHPPNVEPGDRVYIVAHGRLRGYAPLRYIEYHGPRPRFGGRPGGYALVRTGDAIAVTIDEPIRGFQGVRYRWWDREDERPFPDWKTEGVE